MGKIKLILLLFLLSLLVYTRFVNIGWGLPYPIHPDERNMANAVQQLHCENSNNQFPISKQASLSNFQLSKCLNPHFFAYGQFPLYVGYFIVFLMKFFDGDLGTPISFEEATVALRFISGMASVLNAIILLKIISLFTSNFQFLIPNKTSNSKKNNDFLFSIPYLLFPIVIFSPFFIQFSHFGTTESLLMFLYSSLVFVGLKLLQGKSRLSQFILASSVLLGMAVATKVSSILFILVPFLSIVFGMNRFEKSSVSLKRIFFLMLYLSSLTLIVSLILAPHNFISFTDFLGAMRYESDVALGSYVAFYTRQFESAIPLIFQIIRIFPYALGLPVFVFFTLGFLFLPYNKTFNFLRASFIIYFFPIAFMFAKWTRFMSPILPVMLVIAVLFLEFLIFNFQFSIKSQFLILQWRIKSQISNLILIMVMIVMVLPGVAYLSIYKNKDVRFQASEWIYKNIPENSYILSETANVLDIPIPSTNYLLPTKNYTVISFNFYDLDENRSIIFDMQNHLAKADYIFVPSRRIVANHYCPINIQSPAPISNIQFPISKEKCEYLRTKYPLLNQYYDDLFSGRLGFEKVAEFTSFPALKFQISNFKFATEFPDEQAEETWTVFDHPVIRIYKKVSNLNLR